MFVDHIADPIGGSSIIIVHLTKSPFISKCTSIAFILLLLTKQLHFALEYAIIILQQDQRVGWFNKGTFSN